MGMGPRDPAMMDPRMARRERAQGRLGLRRAQMPEGLSGTRGRPQGPRKDRASNMYRPDMTKVMNSNRADRLENPISRRAAAAAPSARLPRTTTQQMSGETATDKAAGATPSNTPMRKGGKVKKPPMKARTKNYKAGGSVKKGIDGCCKKGKTRGRMC
jgi:hypothetical protein